MSVAPHDQRGIRPHYDAKLRPSKARWLFLQELDFVGDISLSAGPVRVANFSPRRAWRRATVNARFYEAARQWLRPNPVDGFINGVAIERLLALRKMVSLDHYYEHDFARELHSQCLEIGAKYPDLRRWIDCRAALLEYVIRPPKPLKRDLLNLIPIFERTVITATARLAQGHLEPAGRLAQELLQKSLDAAKTACCWVISPERADGRTDCSANLMFQVPRTAPHNNHILWRANFERANGLWDGVEHATRLMVLSETNPGAAGQSHCGFWVPIAKSESGHSLPGASEAIVAQRASAVFKDDLPPLTARGFQRSIEGRWSAHMAQYFERKLFISLPIVMPGESTFDVAAVLNVNVSPPEGDKTWNRAYHSHWLDAATDAVGPFGRYAFWATNILMRSGQGVCNPGYLIDSGGVGMIGE